MPRPARLVSRLVAVLVAAATHLAAAAAHAQPALDSIVPPSPVPNGFIADRGPVLDAPALGRLNALVADVQRRTGGDVGVAILRDLRGRAPSDVGVAIYRAWKIGRIDSLGSARRNLGALLLIVPKELAPTKRGECWITTGRGAEATLVDARAANICRDSVIPRLKTKAYEAAIAAGVAGIGATFDTATVGLAPPSAPIAAAHASGTATSGSPVKRYVGMGLLGGALLIGGGGAGIATIRSHRRRKPRLCPRGHGPMVLLPEDEDDAALTPGQATEERVGSVDYDVWACRECDERIVIPYKRWTSYEGCPRCGHVTVKRTTRTLRHATTFLTGLEEVALDCANCGFHDETRRITPQLPPPPPPSSSSSDSGSSWSGGGGSDGGGSSFGGSGETAGGGGGDSY